ncbi:NHLP leader peptide family RiPP precursor [Ruegeria sp. 2205SS24-7]|uniref:NHLP leader peptide family RiPP precursor n=1 Tax=Ruegeria discodermiae TaxID=3064389 RepID=UPI002740C498|nr:NHLP leader peptide family RiPP precursor [Ruegeria sp. 2205SS24-7]MDP5216753.1 NHLP leader peptide family RiPP precursor [Ruegeria sp. 2205SS24-7]
MTPSKQSAAEAQKTAFFEKVWNDDAFAQALEDNPKSALAELGQTPPENVDIRVVRDTEKVKYLHIPAAPKEGEISDAELLDAQGGTTLACVSLSVTVVTVATATTVLTAATGTN